MDTMQHENHPDLIISACDLEGQAIQVMVYDRRWKTHCVTRESYHGAGAGQAQSMSNCELNSV